MDPGKVKQHLSRMDPMLCGDCSSHKKITKEDTWRPDDLKVHIQTHLEESRRRSKREEEHRKHRDGESVGWRHRDPDPDARREREKQRHGERTREESKHRDPDRDRIQDIKRKDVRDDRYKEKRREREKALDYNRHRDGEEKRHDQVEKGNGERRRDRDNDMYKQREKDRRRAERDGELKRKMRELKEEKKTGRETKIKKEEKDKARESNRTRHEYEEKQREGERREKHRDKDNSGHKESEHRRDREDKEKRKRDKESHVTNKSHSQEQHHQDRDREKTREREERDRRHKEASDSKSERERKQKGSSGHDMNERIIRDKETHREESRRRSKREEEHRKHRDPDPDARREREKQRHGESTREKSKHRDPDRDRIQDIKREDVRDDRYKEKRREREKALDYNRHRDGEEKRHDQVKKGNGERRRDRDNDMYKQRDREREKDRRRAERDGELKRKMRELKEEKKTGRETKIKKEEKDKARESNRTRHEYEEKQREGERREKHRDKDNSGHKEREHRRDREDKEKRKRDKESHVTNKSHSQEQHHQDRDREKTREREERDRRHKEASDSKSERERKQKGSSGHDMNERIIRDKEVGNEDTEKDKESSKDYHKDDYDEDFEDYEDDFEDDDEEEEKEEDDNNVREKKRELSPGRREEIEAIQKAIEEENERVYSARSKPTTIESAITQRERHSNKCQTQGKFIDFVSAKQREVSQKVAKKQKKRSEELLRLIDLDYSITFSLLDLPPVNEYDMYIKTFGTANTKQAYVQCNEDNTDRDIQTEEVDMTDKWTQHPQEGNAACGGSKASQDTSVKSTARITTDSRRLTTFLRSAAQVMAVLIEENMAESNSAQRLRSQTDALSFSDGCIQLNTKLPFLHGRQVSLLQFSQVQRQTLLSVHPPPSKTTAVRLDSETVICVWNIWEPSRPQKILLYESEVRCCCFSPGKVPLVFAGTAVGSVVVWDLREHSGPHCNLVVGKEVWTLRYPTFSTDAVLSGVGHLSPVVSVEPVLTTADTSSKSTLTVDIEESLGLSFQLGSLDENGVLTLWVVVELPKGNDSGSQTDLGLRPGGKVKLLHSSSQQTTERLPQDIIMGFGSPESLQLKFLPSDSNHYFIGTNMGLVRHGTRHSLKVLPKFYRSQFDGCRPVEVTALDFSPFGEPFFLVGCSDGTVRLHSVLREDPLMEWSECSSGAHVLSVQWSQTRPAVFCVLDAASRLLIWDLTEKDYMPVITENIHNDRVTAMAMFGEPAKQNTLSGIALAKQSGKVEIQYFKKSLTVPSASDKDKLHSALHNAF